MPQAKDVVRPLADFDSLAVALDGLRVGADAEEIENYKLLLCMAAGGLAPRGELPSSPERIRAFEVVLRGLRSLALPGDTWIGRPDFMTDCLLTELQAEAELMRHQAEPTNRYFLWRGGQVAQQFARSPPVIDLVAENFPSVRPTGIASYLFYDEPGQGLDPHVDTEVYAVNVIVMLRHRFASDPSHLLLYEDSVQPARILLSPGDLAIINAGSVVHGREDMGEGESVYILTIGFA